MPTANRHQSVHTFFMMHIDLRLYLILCHLQAHSLIQPNLMTGSTIIPIFLTFLTLKQTCLYWLKSNFTISLTFMTRINTQIFSNIVRLSVTTFIPTTDPLHIASPQIQDHDRLSPISEIRETQSINLDISTNSCNYDELFSSDDHSEEIGRYGMANFLICFKTPLTRPGRRSTSYWGHELLIWNTLSGRCLPPKFPQCLWSISQPSPYYWSCPDCWRIVADFG